MAAKPMNILTDEKVVSARAAMAAAIDAQPDALKKLKVAGGLAAGAIGSLAGVLAILDHGLKGEGVMPYTSDALAFLGEILGDKDPSKGPMPIANKWLVEAVLASE